MFRRPALTPARGHAPGIAATIIAAAALIAGPEMTLAQSPSPTPPATQGTPPTQPPPSTQTSPSDLQNSPAAGGSPTAAPRNVERKATGRPATDIRVGVYVNVKTDCTSGPLPTIRLAAPPTRGKVQVKSGKINARNYKTCLTLEVPAHVAFYRSEAGFNGDDVFTLEVRYPGGRVEVQKITVNVTDNAPAPKTQPARPAPKTQGI